MIVLNITSPDFWGQPRLGVTLALGIYLLGAGLIAYALHALSARLSAASAQRPPGFFWQSRSGVVLIRALRILGSLVSAAALIVSVKASGDTGLGIIALFMVWPVAFVQIGVGFLPWERYIRPDNDKWLLFAGHLIFAGMVDTLLFSA